MRWCNSFEDLIDFIAYVVLTAPDAFPVDDNMSLSSAFEELEHGLKCAERECGASPAIEQCKTLFREARCLYDEGKVKEGAWKLQDAEELLMAMKKKH